MVWQKKRVFREFPGSPGVRESTLSQLRAWVQFLVGELKSHKLWSAAKKKERAFIQEKTRNLKLGYN